MPNKTIKMKTNKIADLLDGVEKNDSTIQSHVEALTENIDYLLEQQATIWSCDTNYENEIKKIVSLLINLTFLKRDLKEIIQEQLITIQ